MSGNPTAGGRDKILEKRPDDVRILLPAPFWFVDPG